MKGKPKAVNIYTVAERAQVSISTVSLVMNSPHRVSPQTRERVMRAASELGYRVGGEGERGSGRTTALRVAVAAPYSSYNSYYRRLTGMLHRARLAAVDLIPYDLASAAAATEPLLESLPARRGVDGLIVMGVPLGITALRASREVSFPVVGLDIRRSRPRAADPPVVLIDDLHGGRLIGEHLAAAGHRRVAFLHEPQHSPDYVSAGMLRSDGLAEHLELVAVPTDPDGSVDGLLPCLDADPSLTAVVANHDGLAARALRVLTSNGRRVPDDLAVIGYDDGELAEMSGLTTVAQPFAESGRMALEMVLSMVAGSSVPVSRVVLNPTLVLRGTG